MKNDDPENEIFVVKKPERKLKEKKEIPSFKRDKYPDNYKIMN